MLLFLLLGILLLMLCFPTESFTGASNGLLLWFQTLLPTLLPFLILSNLCIRTNCVFYISRALRPFLQKLFRISEVSCYAVFIGFLCGYPMGAKVIADLYQGKQISKEEGQYLLSFCNNTSPMFIISYIVMQTFQNKALLFKTMLTLVLSPVICSFLFRRCYHYSCKKDAASTLPNLWFDFQIVDTAIMNSFETITKIGGYLMLFSIIFTLACHLPIAFLLPCLEISNGIPCIMSLSSNPTVTYPYVLGLTSFGGFCAIAQTKSMIQETNLRIAPYIIQKLITALVTSLFAFLVIHL